MTSACAQSPIIQAPSCRCWRNDSEDARARGLHKRQYLRRRSHGDEVSEALLKFLG